MSPSSSVFHPPVPSLLPSLKPQPSTITSMTTSTTTEDSLGLEYQPLPKREKTSEELRVEALARQLVGTWSQQLASINVPLPSADSTFVRIVLF